MTWPIDNDRLRHLSRPPCHGSRCPRHPRRQSRPPCHGSQCPCHPRRQSQCLLHHSWPRPHPHHCVPSAPPWIRPQPRHPPPWPRHPWPHHIHVWTSRHRCALVLRCPHRWPPHCPCPTRRHWSLRHIMASVPHATPATCLSRRASLGPSTGSAATSAPGPRTTTCHGLHAMGRGTHVTPVTGHGARCITHRWPTCEKYLLAKQL